MDRRRPVISKAMIGLIYVALMVVPIASAGGQTLRHVEVDHPVYELIRRGVRVRDLALRLHHTALHRNGGCCVPKAHEPGSTDVDSDDSARAIHVGNRSRPEGDP